MNSILTVRKSTAGKALSRTAYLAILGVVVLIIGACSSGGSSASSSAAAAAPSAAAAAPSAAAAESASSADPAASDALAAAQAAVDAALVRPTELPFLELPAKPEPGGVIDVIACGVPSCQQFADIVQEAVAPLGWEVKFLNAGVTAKDLAAAYDQAVRDNPDGVIGTGGANPLLVAKQLKKLADAGIPVVMQYASVDEPLEGLTAIVYGSQAAEANGKLLGQKILVDSGGKDAHVLYVGTPEVANNFKWTRTGARSVLEAPGACENCSSGDLDMTLASIGTKLPGVFISYLRANPEINYVVGDFGDVIGGFPQALEQAGLADKVKLLANGVGAIQADYLKKGQMLAAAYNPNLEILWTDAGVILAHQQGVDLGLDAKNEVAAIPPMLITPENVVIPPADGYWPMIENYQDLFAQAWKNS